MSSYEVLECSQCGDETDILWNNNRCAKCHRERNWASPMTSSQDYETEAE